MNPAFVQKPDSELPSAPLRRLKLTLAEPRTLAAAEVSKGVEQDQSTLSARLASLKLLALSLMKQIESLEDQTLANTAPELDLQAEVRRFEAELIRNALIKTQGKQRRAARMLGMKVTTLNTKIKRYHLEVKSEE